MKSHAKSRTPSLILAGIVALFVLLLLLRLFVFAHGHGRRGLHSAVATRGRGSSRELREAALGVPPPWTDRFNDGTPDFLRLTDPADQAAFRQWFTTIADFQAIRPHADVPAGNHTTAPACCATPTAKPSSATTTRGSFRPA
jgi:hypothetical protein